MKTSRMIRIGLAWLMAGWLVAPMSVAASTTTEAVARQYMKAIATRDLDGQPYASDMLFQDVTAEYFDMAALVAGVEGQESVVAMQRSWNLEKIDFTVELEFFVGEWAVFAGTAKIKTRTEHASDPMGFVTVLRVVGETVSERHDFWSYAEAFDPTPEQKTAAVTTRTVADAYLEAYLEQRFDDARALMAEDIEFRDPTATVFSAEIGGSIQGAETLNANRRATFGSILDFGLDVTTARVSDHHAVYIGRTHYTLSGASVGSERESVRFEHPAVFVVGVRDGKVDFHRDFVDYSDFRAQAQAQAQPETKPGKSQE